MEPAEAILGEWSHGEEVPAVNVDTLLSETHLAEGIVMLGGDKLADAFDLIGRSRHERMLERMQVSKGLAGVQETPVGFLRALRCDHEKHQRLVRPSPAG